MSSPAGPAEVHEAAQHPRQGEPCPALSRRALLSVVGVGVGAAGAVWAARPARARQPDVPVDVDPTALLPRLVERVTFGLTPEQYALALTLGYEGYLDYHLYHLAISDAGLVSQLNVLTALQWSYAQLAANGTGQGKNELIEAAVRRAVFSKRQLFERAVEMWTDHFHIDINKNSDQFFKVIDDREVIRPHALGTFSALLSASVHSPAMLYFLDNNVSTKNKPNENYPRELMELHTLGVDAGFTQQDVQEVARCFTGWTFHPASAGDALYGTFLFNATNHDQGEKTVLGQFIPANGGQQDGETVIQILAQHPATSRMVAHKICRQFLGYDVPRSTEEDVAAVYTATGGDIKAMIRRALRPSRLAAAAPKLKRPFHHAVSAIRSVPTVISGTSVLRTYLSQGGHLPFNWPAPDGYPDRLEHWAGNVISRWNFAAQFMNNSISGLVPDTAAFFFGAGTAQSQVDRINADIFASRLSDAERQELLAYAAVNPSNLTRQRETLGLAFSSPFFQWY